MHDIAYIRANPHEFDAAMQARGAEPVAKSILEEDDERRKAETLYQTQLAERNKSAKEIGAAKAAGNDALFAELMERSKRRNAIGDEAAQVSKELKKKLDDMLLQLPNIPADDVPIGADESDNVEVASWGTKRDFDFAAKEHADIGPALGMEFETGAAMSGARFTFLRGNMARLHRALAQFMLDRQTGERDYTECNPPILVRDEALYGTGQLPKFGEDSFQTREGHWLIPTAEVSLTNSVREQILDASALPTRLTAHTPCFRSEAGAAGRDTRGFIRQHQFEKVELVSICAPEDHEAEHAHMVASAQGVLEALDLPYRTMLLCTGDMGATAKKTFDLEVWLPGQGAYREISSISWCGEYQARRMNTRYRREGEKKTRFVHTLNGSGLAVGRTLVAVMENYQNADGSVDVPDVLAPYMGGVTKLEPQS